MNLPKDNFPELVLAGWTIVPGLDAEGPTTEVHVAKRRREPNLGGATAGITLCGAPTPLFLPEGPIRAERACPVCISLIKDIQAKTNEEAAALRAAATASDYLDAIESFLTARLAPLVDLEDSQAANGLNLLTFAHVSRARSLLADGRLRGVPEIAWVICTLAPVALLWRDADDFPTLLAGVSGLDLGEMVQATLREIGDEGLAERFAASGWPTPPPDQGLWDS